MARAPRQRTSSHSGLRGEGIGARRKRSYCSPIAVIAQFFPLKLSDPQSTKFKYDMFFDPEAKSSTPNGFPLYWKIRGQYSRFFRVPKKHTSQKAAHHHIHMARSLLDLNSPLGISGVLMAIMQLTFSTLFYHKVNTSNIPNDSPTRNQIHGGVAGTEQLMERYVTRGQPPVPCRQRRSFLSHFTDIPSFFVPTYRFSQWGGGGTAPRGCSQPTGTCNPPVSLKLFFLTFCDDFR